MVKTVLLFIRDTILIALTMIPFIYWYDWILDKVYLQEVETMRRKWKPSKTAKREFSKKMQEIDNFCLENGISVSVSNDSYYFTINEQKYRVSNHSVESSCRNSHGKYHTDGRQDNVIYIHAGKTRIIDIYNDLVDGYELDGHGNRI